MAFTLLAPVEVVLGTAYGLVFGVVLAVVVGCCSLALAFVTEYRLPSSVVGVSAVGIAGVGAITVGVAEPIPAQTPRFLIGTAVVFALGVYGATHGTRMAGDLPRPTAHAPVCESTLTADAISDVDAAGQVSIRPSGRVREFEGYPPIEASLRDEIVTGSWRLPADLPLPELERRLADRLRTTHDLAAVDVAIDGRGRATITAAPPLNPVSKRVPEGWRAVSVPARCPDGVVPGERVRLHTGGASVSGRLLSVTTDDRSLSECPESPGAVPSTERRPAVETVTVAVPAADADFVLEADRVRVAVEPTDTTAAFEAVAALEHADSAVRSIPLTDSVLAAIRDGVTDLNVIAVRRSRGGPWSFFPNEESLERGVAVLLVGTDADAVARESTAEPSSTATPAEVGGT